MSDIRRSPDGPRVKLGDAETQLLIHLVDDVDLLLASRDDASAAAPASAAQAAAEGDPLAEMTGLRWPDGASVAAPSDPALRRLLPDAYRDDDEAASDFRRYTEATLREEKRADATVVRQGLASLSVTGQRVLDDRQTQAWLRFLTDARLVVASWLGIEKAGDEDRFDDLDDDDPARAAYAAYAWLGELLYDLLAAIDAA